MPRKNLSNEELIKYIIDAIQEKKGKSIVVANLTGLGSSLCDYFGERHNRLYLGRTNRKMRLQALCSRRTT